MDNRVSEYTIWYGLVWYVALANTRRNDLENLMCKSQCGQVLALQQTGPDRMKSWTLWGARKEEEKNNNKKWKTECNKKLATTPL